VGSSARRLRASAIDSEQSRIEASSIAFSSGARSTSNTFSTPPGAEHDRGLGLPSMRERVAQFDGQFNVVTEPGAGTRVYAVVGLPAEQEVR
jgi:signal transduction histidine kinase